MRCVRTRLPHGGGDLYREIGGMIMISTRELAELAGVSQSTISRCLNDHPSISFETKERVRKLALQYGYVENRKGKKSLFNLLPFNNNIFLIVAFDFYFIDSNLHVAMLNDFIDSIYAYSIRNIIIAIYVFI